MNTSQKAPSSDLIDQLLSDYQKPEDLIGEHGLLKHLTKAIVERALQAEMNAHLGNSIRDVNTLTTHASRGALFETLVVPEWIKRQFNAGQVAELYFWRDSAGHEVDLLIPQGK